MFGLKLQEFWTARKTPLEEVLPSDIVPDINPDISVVTDAEPLPSEGILAGTRIATEDGWRPVETLQPGDWVMTFDHGVQELLRIERIAPASAPRVILVPQDALGNATPMLLLGDQSVMVESDLAGAAFGDPFVLVPSETLEGLRGIEAVTLESAPDIFRLHFAGTEVVYANGWGLIHCAADMADTYEAEPRAYPILPQEAARMVVEALIENEAATC